jgi:4-amino-4-deoxy-L-arabinose transferase-like glycosyltransferase
MNAYIRKYAIWVIILVGVLPFFSTLNFVGFLSDGWEFLHIAETQPFTLERMLFTNTQGFVGPSSYRPMVNIYWGVMYQLFSLAAVWYHASILLLYAASIYLLYATLRRSVWLGRYQDAVALVAAAFFAWNPVRVSALSWVSIVNDVMLVFFTLLAWYLFSRWQTTQGTQRWRWYAGALIAGACAIGSKEVGVTLPLVIGAAGLLTQLQTKGTTYKEVLRSIVRATLTALPFVLLVVVYMLLRFQATEFIAEDYTGSAFVWFDGFTVRSYVSVLVSFFFADPLRTPLTEFGFMFAGWLGAIGMYTAGVWLHAQKKTIDRYTGGVLLLLLACVMYPASRFGVNFLSIYTSSEGERYAYYPSVFAGIFIAWLLRKHLVKLSTHRYVLLIALCIGVVHGVCSVLPRIAYWQEASRRAELIVTNTVEHLQGTAYDQVYFVGLPDMYYGAYVWRNAFVLRLTTFEDIPYIAEQLVYSDVRTILRNHTLLTASREANGTVSYKGTTPSPTIVGPTNSVQYGYTAEMPGYKREPLSIAHSNFATSTIFTPTEDNTNAHRALFLFDGDQDWIVYEQ